MTAPASTMAVVGEKHLGEAASAEKQPRYVSVDALRGFDMFWIIGADQVARAVPKIHDSPLTRALAAQMEHCEWAGFHFYDLIFPLFVFTVGVSLVFSLCRMLEREGCAAAIKRIVVRSVCCSRLALFTWAASRKAFTICISPVCWTDAVGAPASGPARTRNRDICFEDRIDVAFIIR